MKMTIIATKNTYSVTATLLTYEGRYGQEWAILKTYTTKHGNHVAYTPSSSRDKKFVLSVWEKI